MAGDRGPDEVDTLSSTPQVSMPTTACQRFRHRLRRSRPRKNRAAGGGVSTNRTATGRYASIVVGALAPNFANRTMWTRDNLDVLRGLNSESIDFVYADPPADRCPGRPSDDPRTPDTGRDQRVETAGSPEQLADRAGEPQGSPWEPASGA